MRPDVAAMRVDDRRARVIAEAASWLRTPWHHRQRVKGVGVDCAQLLIAVYAAAGIIDDFDTGNYPRDWHLHRDEPRFLAVLKTHSTRVDGEPAPGDVAMFNFGRHAAHGAIVVSWPGIIHAYAQERGVVISDAVADASLARRFDSAWRLPGLADAGHA